MIYTSFIVPSSNGKTSVFGADYRGSSPWGTANYAALAHMVERRFSNPKAVSSILTGSTTNFSRAPVVMG